MPPRMTGRSNILRWLFKPPQSKSPKVSLTIDVLPTEIILLIASKLPVNAYAIFSLTCKRFYHTLSAQFEGLNMPIEQPPNLQEIGMSKPQLYQPERCVFLRLLENDLSSTWSLCSDCFVLHPNHMFAANETSLVHWYRKFSRSKEAGTRSCSHPLSTVNSQEIVFSPCGIVDLCPCIKLTPRKRREIEASIRAAPQSREKVPWWHDCRHVYENAKAQAEIYAAPQFESDKPWTHECRHLYGNIEVQTNICFSLNLVTGSLRAAFKYRHTRPSDSLDGVSPRLSCPHQSLDAVIQNLWECRKTHPDYVVCAWCKDVQRCKDCLTTVVRLVRSSSCLEATTSYLLYTERQLDDRSWCKQTVFPFVGRHTSM